MSSALDIDACRREFPALSREIAGRPAVFFDGPAGSQVPRSVINAISDYLENRNANHGGVFLTSVESDAMLAEAHQASADFVGASDPDLVSFGPNMTTLTFSLSRALASTWSSGDEVLICQTEHDANFTPWVRAAADAGAKIATVAMRPEDCTLDLDDLAAKLSARTRLVAVGCASNAVGTMHPVRRIVEMAHEVGALVFLDAVHYAPHATIDVAAWDCDFLACSAYKFFGPHIGVLYGKRRWMEELPAYKVRPASDAIPDRWMTGTQNHECIAGTLAAIDYLAALGRDSGGEPSARREALVRAYDGIIEYERGLLRRLLAKMSELDSVRVLGITDESRIEERVPTISFTHARQTPERVAAFLAERGIFVWAGNFYALPLSEALGLEPEGMVRVGLLHYNTAEEVDRLVDALRELD